MHYAFKAYSAENSLQWGKTRQLTWGGDDNGKHCIL